MAFLTDMKISMGWMGLAAAVLVSGCGRQEASAPQGATAPAAPREVDITANDTMKFNVTSIEARPGEYMTVVLTNTGALPETVMAHNWILLKAGSDPAAFSAAGAAYKDLGYIAPELADEVLARIGLQGPRKSGEVTFRAPEAPGEYPFLCSFPAHFQAGMHGVLVVKQG
jgi:azurin